MATLAEIKAQCELFEQQQLPVIQKVQAQYFTDNKRYFQGVATPDKLPDDGSTLDGDFTKKPTDQRDTWADVFRGMDVLPAKIPARTAIDVYQGPKGWGYIVRLHFHKTDDLAARQYVYTRLWDYGPEGRSTDWERRVFDPDIDPTPERLGAIRSAMSTAWRVLNTPIGDLFKA